MKKTIIILATLLTYLVATAQEFNRHEFSINAGGGISSLQTKPTEGKDLWNWTGQAGLGYHFFFSPHWGIGIGANFAIYNGGMSIDDYSKTQTTTNPSGTAFEFQVSSSDYKEPVQTMMVTIPLMVQYQTTGKTAFYAALGGKVGIPVSATGKTEGSFTTKGKYDIINVTYQDLPDYGFVSDQAFPENETDLTLKTAFMASAELGVKWRLGAKTSLYTGLYADYGLNDILDKEAAPANTNLVVYQPNTPTQFAYNTATNSYAEQIAPLAAGITLRLAFGCGSRDGARPVSTETVKPVQQQPVDDSAARAAEAKRLADEEAARQRAAAEAEANRLAQEKAAAERAAAEQIAKQKAIIQEPVERYALSQVELTDAQKKELDERIALLQQNPNLNFYIYGHTCDLGGDEVNERVGLQRAEKAKAYMLAKGIDPKRILGTASKLDREPIVPNTSEENRRINRRVEVKIAE